MRLTAILKWVFVVSLLGVLFLWAATWFVWTIQVRAQSFIGSSAIIAAGSMCAMSCSECLGRRRRILQMWSGVFASSVAAAVWVYLLWFDAVLRQDTIDTLTAAGGLISTWATLCAVVGLVARHRSKNLAALVLALTTEAAVVVLAVAVALAILAPDDFGPEEGAYGKLMGTVAVVMGFSLISWLIVSRLKQLNGEEDDDDETRLSFTLTCPRCGVQQPFTTGGADCNGCGLRVRISVP